MLHHFRTDLVAESRLDHTNGRLARPEARHASASRELLRDVRDLLIDHFLGNLDVEILLALADVDKLCLHHLFNSKG